MKRQILGEEIVKAIRFPLMSEKEFVSVVIDSYILTPKEVGDMMKYYNDVLTSPLSFIQASRLSRISAFSRCHRFERYFYPQGGRWGYSGLADEVCFTINKPIKLHRVQHFGSKDGKYTVSIVVKDSTDESCLVEHSGSYTSAKDETYGFFGFDLLFDSPVNLEENKKYELVSLIQGPNSWYGKEGRESVESTGVQFTFDSFFFATRTTEYQGQFPTFIFS